jgi:hypothetical protein
VLCDALGDLKSANDLAFRTRAQKIPLIVVHPSVGDVGISRLNVLSLLDRRFEHGGDVSEPHRNHKTKNQLARGVATIVAKINISSSAIS